MWTTFAADDLAVAVTLLCIGLGVVLFAIRRGLQPGVSDNVVVGATSVPEPSRAASIEVKAARDQLSSLVRDSNAVPTNAFCERVAKLAKQLSDSSDASDALLLANCASVFQRAGGAWLPRIVDVFRSALAVNKRANSGRGSTLSGQLLHNMAGTLLDLGRDSEALEQVQAAIAMFQQLRAERSTGRSKEETMSIDAGHASSIATRATALSRLGRKSEAHELQRTAVELWRAVARGGSYQLEFGFALHSLGSALADSGRAEEGLQHLREALPILRRACRGRDDPVLQRNLGANGRWLVATGRIKEALPLVNEALAMMERIYGGRDHADALETMRTFGVTCVAVGKYDQAIDSYRSCIDMTRRLHGRNHDSCDLASDQSALGYLLSAFPARRAEGMDLLRKRVAMYRRVLGGNVDDKRLGCALMNLGQRLNDFGQTIGEARAILTEAVEMQRRVVGPGVRDVVLAQCLSFLSDNYEATGNRDQASALRAEMKARSK